MFNIFEVSIIKTILIIAVSATLLLLIFRESIVPLLRKRRIDNQRHSCPSLLIAPRPPEMDRQILQSSRSDPALKYRLNLYKLTCNCAKFRRFRGFFPEHDIRRLCRHLRRELDDSRFIDQIEELQRAIIKDRVRDFCYQKTTIGKTEAVFGFNPKSDFVRVFTHRKEMNDPADGPFTGSCDKFVLNVTQENWIYGEPPPGAAAVIAAVSAHMAQFTTQHRVIKINPQRSDPPL